MKSSLILVVFLCAFIFGGYWLSDNRLASEVVTEQNLKTPEDVFNYVLSKNNQAPSSSAVGTGGASFRELMFRHGDWLWCDEGSIVIAVLVGRLRYETRLVDLVGVSDGVSHHTVIQLKQDGRWVTYDFTNRTSGRTPEQSVDYTSVARYRVYPSWKHDLLLNNYFLRKSAQLFWTLRSQMN